jgi:hypothetical protein
LLCQYFLRRVLAGASLGRAALEARQEFATAGPDLDPVDIKTMAQFSLFGDPSIHPVAVPTPHTAMVSGLAKGSRKLGSTAGTVPANLTPEARAERRKQALTKGLFIRTSQAVACRTNRAVVAGALAKALLRLAAGANITKPKTISFKIQPGTNPAGGAKAKKAFATTEAKQPKASAYHVAIGSRSAPGIGTRQVTAVIAKEFGGKLVSYRELVSR